MRNTSNKYQVGTSGFMISRSKWMSLEYLNCIEINSTFYNLPTTNIVRNWCNLPERISFIIKASKYITHVKQLKNVKDAWNKLWEYISPLEKRLRVVLFQMPPSFAYSDVNLNRIIAMHAYIPLNLNVAFEFRNDTWFRLEVYRAFHKIKWCVAGTYIQKNTGTSWMGTMHGGLTLPPRTAAFNYLRVHGAQGYKGSLSEAQLISLRKALRAQKSLETYVMFNNTFFDPRSHSCFVEGQNIKYAAIYNAVEFTKLLQL